MEISIMIEGQMGLTWDRWRSIASVVENSGFAGLFRSDHFTNAGGPPQDSLELIVSLTYAADHTSRIHLGQLVSPLSFRDPVMLARQAAAIDELSGGRFIFGVGAGWQQREHEMFGYDLGSVGARMARLGEGLQVISALLRSREPVTFEGEHYRLKDAELLPRRPEGRPPLLLGGNGPRRSIPLAARYADWWNASGLPPDAFKERSQILSDHASAEGRDPAEIKRTMMLPVFVGADHAEAASRFGPMAGHPAVKGKAPREALAALRAGGVIAGTYEEADEQFAGLEAAGVEEVMLQWFNLDDIDGIEQFAAKCATVSGHKNQGQTHGRR